MSSSSNESDTLLPPFHEGDIIVRSRDDVDFLMYKLDLSRASPVFRTMLSLPQPTASPSPAEPYDYLPVVELSEPGAVLATLLALCVPMQQVADTLEDLKDVADIIEAARTYDMEWLVGLARQVLKNFVEAEALRVYAIACRFELEDETRLAARACLRLPMKTILTCDSEDLDSITGRHLLHLMNYQDDCRNAVKQYLQTTVHNTCDTFAGVVICSNCIPPAPHSTNWKFRYVAKLTDVLKDCVWEGAVRAEHAFAAHMRPSRGEMCKNTYCLSIDQSQLAALHTRVTSEIANVIDKVSSIDILKCTFEL